MNRKQRWYFRGTGVAVALLMVLLFGSGCGFLQAGAKGTEPKQVGEREAAPEGYTRVEVLAVLEGAPLQEPAGVAVDAAGNVYISDGATHCIYRFTPEGKLAAEIGSEGKGPGQFIRPGALAVDGAGNLYVADTGNNRVQVLSPTGEFLRQVGSREEFARFFSLADGYDVPLTGVAVDAVGNIYLTLSGSFYDISENALRKYSPAGKMLLEIRSTLEGDIDLLPFTRPAAVAVDGKGTVYLVHGANGVGKVIKIPFAGDTPLAEQAFQFGNLGKGKGELMHTPKGIAVDSRGNIYVADTFNNRVQVFDAQGEWLLMFHLKGTPYGELTGPTNLTLDKDGNLYVVDRGNARVLKIANPLG